MTLCALPLLSASDCLSAPPEPKPELRAGASVVDISPEKLPVIVNAMFEERSANVVTDPLYARCLVLDDGTTRLALAVVDSCMLPRDLIDRAKDLASKETGIPTERMLISATHTHSAPSAMGCLGSRVDPEYAASLPPKIAKAIVQAANQMVSARVGWASVDDWHHTFNRRWIRRPDRLLTDPFGVRNVRAHMHPGYESKDVTGPSGPVDPALSLLAVQTREGKPLALLANYSQHYYGSPLLSSDYYGRFVKYVGQKLGAGEHFVGIMSQGTSGDLMWMDYSRPHKEIGYDAYAQELAEEVTKAYRKIEWKESVPLAMAEARITLGFRVPDEPRLTWAERMASTLGDRIPRGLPEIYAMEALYLRKRPTAELKLQAVRVGDLGIAAIPNEVFALTGLKLKAQSPFPTTFNIELANGAEGYIPPPEQHKLGGYTTWSARTAGLVPEAEPKIVDTLLSLLEQVYGKPRKPLADEQTAYSRAVLDSKPSAFWRLNDAVIPTAQDASGHGNDATFEDGVALYLPGADASTGVEARTPPTPNAFSGEQINRSVHFAGGRMRSDALKSGNNYSVELWLWNGLPNDARAVTGYVISLGLEQDKQCPGDHLGIGGTWRPDVTGKLLFFNGNDRNQVLLGRTTLAWREWHHVVLVREGRKVTVWLNGNTEPEISGECDVTLPAGKQPLFIGGRSDNMFNFEGKIDEVAVYDRALSGAEIAGHYRISGLPAKLPTPKPTTDTAPLSPEESLQKIRLREGFRAEIVAAEPLVLDPVAIDWDAAGRLWVVEMADYPSGMDNNGAPGGRVRVLEDIDGDGRYDKSTLFAEGLQMPTGLLTWRDGVLITTAPEILFLKDTNGDGRADVREVLYSGFLVGNPQLRVNGLRWGLDNWIYCAAGGHHGNYGVGTKIRSMRTGADVTVGSRDVRIRPDTGEIEPQSGPSQFGRNRDEWGRWFGTQNSWPLWHYALADHYLRRNPHIAPPDPVVKLTSKTPRVFPASPQEKRFHSFAESGHFTSACSGMIYGDDLLFPRGERSHAFICEPFHNLVHHELITDKGVTFRAERAQEEQMSEFLASEDRWFRPVMSRTGPDGALWVVDMYRYMIEHPEWLPPQGRAELLPHYREGEDRGRIYRIVPAGAASRKFKRLDRMSTGELVAALDSPNHWQRDKVQQLLVWKVDPAASAPLAKLFRESQNPLTRLHALCTLDGLNVLDPELLVVALADRDAGVRENAIRMAESRGTEPVVEAAAQLVNDQDAKVRLQLAFSLGAWEGPTAGEALGRLAAANHNDRYITAAVMSSVVPHRRALTSVVAASNNGALTSLAEPLLNLALALNDRDTIATLLKATLRSDSGQLSVAQMEGFDRFLSSLTRAKSSLEALAIGEDELSREMQSAKRVFESAGTLAADGAKSPLERIAAARLLVYKSDRRSDALAFLADWLNPKHALEIQRAALHALAATGDDTVPRRLMSNWTALGPETRAQALEQLLSWERWALDLLEQIEKQQIAVTALDAAQRERLLKHSSVKIRASAERILSNALSADRAKVIEQYRPALAVTGEPSRGLAIFSQRCASCHKRGELGRDIGPDLRSVVAHEPARLLAAILDPNADVQPGYHAYQCRLSSGEELYGIITAETATSITLKLADANNRTFLRSEIAKLESTNASLMPAGLEAGMTSQAMADLIAFLRVPLPE